MYVLQMSLQIAATTYWKRCKVRDAHCSIKSRVLRWYNYVVQTSVVRHVHVLYRWTSKITLLSDLCPQGYRPPNSRCPMFAGRCLEFAQVKPWRHVTAAAQIIRLRHPARNPRAEITLRPLGHHTNVETVLTSVWNGKYYNDVDLTSHKIYLQRVVHACLSKSKLLVFVGGL